MDTLFNPDLYQISDTSSLITPALVYYPDIIDANTTHMLEMAGNPSRLWPHIKTHKSLDMTKYLISRGISQFKTATIAEAEMCCMAGARRVVLAYPAVGPAIPRLIRLREAYPQTEIFAIGDDLDTLTQLGKAASSAGRDVPFLIDVDMGQHRTGVSPENLYGFAEKAAAIQGLHLMGLHCYDGQRHEKDFEERDRMVQEEDRILLELLPVMREKIAPMPVVIAGGTPSFPCHQRHTDWYLSPGTSFIHDAGYTINFPDLGCVPAAAVATRVVSHPAPHTFTLDAGVKAIACDSPKERGYIAGMEEAQVVMHNEEHWVFRVPEDKEVPSIGTVLYIIPTHICPTTALYPEIQLCRGGSLCGVWPVTARNRRITI